MIQVVNKRSYTGPGEYIARPSVFGNRYSHRPSKYLDTIQVRTREEAIECWEKWFDEQPDDSDVKVAFRMLVEQYRKEGELVLICWCAPANCHGHILARKIHEAAGDQDER